MADERGFQSWQTATSVRERGRAPLGLGQGLYILTKRWAGLLLIGLRIVVEPGMGRTETWPDGEFPYRINAGSFVDYVNNPYTLNLTANDYQWWVAYAVSQWSVRSGAGFQGILNGTTTDNPCQGEHDFDGVSVIAATDECSNFLCDLGWGFTYCQSEEGPGCGYYEGGTLLESDICIYRWELAGTDVLGYYDIQADMLSSRKDLIGVIVHETGHAIGLVHPEVDPEIPITVMSELTFNFGNTMARYPYGDDIEALRALYGTASLSEYFREYDANSDSFGAAYSRPGSVNMGTSGAIVRSSLTTWKVVRAAMSTGNGTLWFDFSTYPLSSSSSWSNASRTIDAWHSPAIAADDSSPSGTLLAAVPLALAGDPETECSGVRFWTSDNLFSSVSSGTSYSICTNHPVAVTWDTASDLWVLAYVRVGGPYDGEIFMRYSDTGTYWSSTTESGTGYFTIDGPALACESSNCVLSFVNAVTDKATPRNVTFSVSTSGFDFDSSALDSANWTGRTPAIGVNSSGVYYQWMFWTSSYANVSRGIATTYSEDDTVPPVSYGTWHSSAESSSVRAGLASHPLRSLGYMLFAE